MLVLKHVTWLDATGDSATFVGKKVVKTDKMYEVAVSSDYNMKMAAALDLTDAKTMNAPGTREA